MKVEGTIRTKWIFSLLLPSSDEDENFKIFDDPILITFNYSADKKMRREHSSLIKRSGRGGTSQWSVSQRPEFESWRFLC